MANARTVGVSIVAAVAAIAVLGGGGYYVYEQLNYVSTDNASIQAALVPLTAPADGTLTHWRAPVGATIARGAVIGRIDGLGSVTDVSAPITGTVVQNYAADNETVVPGEQIGYMVNLHNIHIVANVPEASISNVAVGKTVDISVDAYPGTKFTGAVTQIGSATAVVANGVPNTSLSSNFQKTTQNVPVYISIDGTEGKNLLPGMSVEVAIHRN